MTTPNRTMLTDLYQLTMHQAYLENAKGDDVATFDLFIRSLPRDWGYFIANGIEDAIDYATNIHFEEEDIEYLRGTGLFKQSYLKTLEDFTFRGEIAAVPEGTPISANAPLLRVRAKRSEAQLLETILLNTVNFQTMIASKASRVVHAAGDAGIVEFGLRRAQGRDAALSGARAAYLAGAIGTSDVEAGALYGIPLSGTMAHSFVMSFDTEIEAFRAYLSTYPAGGVLLVDTYDTIEGVRNAIVAAKELERAGGKLAGIRLDSGDLADLSKDARAMLDDAGLSFVKILASNDLNEERITDLRAKGARIDGYGVGTELITAKPTSAIPGVYKLAEDEAGPKMKLAPGKRTYPGKKQLYRVFDALGNYSHDLLALEGESMVGVPLLETVVRDGERIVPRRTLEEIRRYSLASVERLPANVRALHASPYELRISPGLGRLVDELSQAHEVFA